MALGTSLLHAKGAVGLSRISAISDEIANTPEDALAFARQYGLKWLELRGVPGTQDEYAFLGEADARRHAASFKAAGVGVSFLDSSLLKFGLPGTEPVRRRQEKPEVRAKRLAEEQQKFEHRMDDLKTALRNCQILGVRGLRVFTFHRVADAHALYPRIAEILGEMTAVAEKAKVRLLIENEPSCNVATCAEMQKFLNLVPSRYLGVCWDAYNGTYFKEPPYPDGYALLPKDRIGNVQIKGKSVLPGPERLDWKTIFETMHRDGYRGHFGLETHLSAGGELIAQSHASIKAILQVVGS